jgi:FkbM family methyltransferase
MRSAHRSDAVWAASLLLRFVPSGLGAHALARNVIRKTCAGPPTLRTQKLNGHARFELDLSDRAQAHAYVLGRYEPDIVALIARRAPRGGVFFDVGANIGLITFSVGVRRPDLSIHAFEPDPANVERWHRNCELNPGVRARLEETAVGATRGEIGLARGEESGWSFIADETGDISVRVIDLDAHASANRIARIDVLKIDVEGYEAKVLEGARSLLQHQAVGLIVCELDDTLLRRDGATRGSVAALLAENGYAPGPVPGVGAHRFRHQSWESSRDVVFAPVRTAI